MPVGRDDDADGGSIAITAREVEKRYGETTALDGVSLSVPRGSVFALIGPNGAGKTTLVRALTGTTVPDDGEATILGDSPTMVDRNRISVLPQDFSPPARLSASELLEYYAGLYTDSRSPSNVLEDVGLADVGATWYEDLSGGQQRRVCVGAALVNDPEVLFLDEPTTGIDPAGRRTVWQLLEALTASGTTIVLTTHDMAEAERLADRVGLLANGNLVATGTPTELIAAHGGPDRLAIQFTGERPPDAAIQALETAGYDVQMPPHTASIEIRDTAPHALGEVLETLEEATVEFTGFQWRQPALEDVYLRLARDVEAAGRGERARSLEYMTAPGPARDGGAPPHDRDGGGNR